MGSIKIFKGMKIARTPEQLAEIEALSKMTDADIDLSDIPEVTEEEAKKFKPARFRKKNLKIAG